MGRRIALINQKGGTGKTTTTGNLGAGLALRGHRVLMVDCDPQGSLSVWFGVDTKRTLTSVILDGVPPKQCIRHVRPRLYLLPSDNSLLEAEAVIAGLPCRDRALAERLQGIEDYDYLLLDCAPSWSVLSQNVISFTSEVLIPASMEYLALVGIRQIVRNLVEHRGRGAKEVTLTLVIPTFYDARHRKDREVLATLRRHFGHRVAEPIRANVRLSEAVSYHQTIFEYAARSNGARDFDRLVGRVENG